jgi:uncharacterized protein
MKTEKRSNPRRVTVTKREDKPSTISGMAALYYSVNDPGTVYRLWSDMEERIRPGAFDRAVKEDDVRALFNHDPNQVLGRGASGTLRLRLEPQGLGYDIDPPDTQVGRDVLTILDRGDVTGSSFAFVPRRTTWEEVRDADGSTTYIRWIEEVELFDVGPVTYPAYDSTTSTARSTETVDDVRAELGKWLEVRRSAGRADSDLVAVTLALMETA